MSFSFPDIFVIISIIFFFAISYQWMTILKKYQTILRIVWGVFYFICSIWLIKSPLENNLLWFIFIYGSFWIPIIYSILFSYTSLSRYAKYMDEGIYSLSVFLLLLLLMLIIGIVGDYKYDSTWEDLYFWKLSSLWILAHIPFFISSKNRKWFFHRFYLFLVIIIFIWGLFEYDLYESIIWMSYGVFFIVYIVAILIGKYIQIHLERK